MAYTLYRRDANTAAPSSVTRALVTAVAASSSRSSSSSPSSTSTSNNNNNNNSSPYDYNSSAFTTSWITYLAIIVCAGVVVALVSSRYFYIRRYYDRPTLRAYFVPHNGIHFLGLHVRGPPGQRTLMTNMTSLDEVYGASGVLGGPGGGGGGGPRGDRRRRRRRNRQTVGDTLGPGGTRIGDGDDDDGWDYDDVDLESATGTGTGTGGIGRGGGGRTRGDLPQYEAESGLPAYVAPTSTMTMAATAGGGGDPLGSVTEMRSRGDGGAGGIDEVDALPSAAEYEAHSRGNRDGTLTAIPTYPPAVHIHGAPLYPSEPPPSFSRANSGISTRSRRLPPPPVPVGGVVNDSRSTFEGVAAEPATQVADASRRDEDGVAATRRRQSTATAGSSASKLDDDDDDLDLELDADSVKSTGAAAAQRGTTTAAAAAGSRVTLGSSSLSSGDSDLEKRKRDDADTDADKEQ